MGGGGKEEKEMRKRGSVEGGCGIKVGKKD